ncbi:ribbon-helix-helix protein, CopG family [Nitratifractor sp.]|uniref:ribbon-helix-helix protein, CopG family n=1 Tax=Nitratifractor sp. TaxID=2268144 RepID=UPI0025F593D3|nr:ribbon-helix-helix protein, CopG family [Nitratifractor sp.]
MLTVRLPEEMERKIDKEARYRRSTKTEVVKEALELYFNREERQSSPFELGAELFGRFGSGREDNSIRYKEQLKEKIAEKTGR